MGSHRFPTYEVPFVKQHFRNSTPPILLHHKGALTLRPADTHPSPVDQGSAAYQFNLQIANGISHHFDNASAGDEDVYELPFADDAP